MQNNIPKPVLKNHAAPTDKVEPPPRKLLDRVRDAIRVRQFLSNREKLRTMDSAIYFV